jgi:hypothetical protein
VITSKRRQKPRYATDQTLPTWSICVRQPLISALLDLRVKFCAVTSSGNECPAAASTTCVDANTTHSSTSGQHNTFIYFRPTQHIHLLQANTTHSSTSRQHNTFIYFRPTQHIHLLQANTTHPSTSGQHNIRPPGRSGLHGLIARPVNTFGNNTFFF